MLARRCLWLSCCSRFAPLATFYSCVNDVDPNHQVQLSQYFGYHCHHMGSVVDDGECSGVVVMQFVAFVNYADGSDADAVVDVVLSTHSNQE